MDQHYASHADIERMRADLIERTGQLEVRLVERMGETEVRLIDRINAAESRLEGKIAAVELRLEARIDAMGTRIGIWRPVSSPTPVGSQACSLLLAAILGMAQILR